MKQEEAHVAAAQVIEIHPGFSLEKYEKTLPFKDTRQIDLVTDALRKAGLK